MDELEDRLKKAISFFRSFQNKSDKQIYRKSVLAFCDLVEEYIDLNFETDSKKIFNESPEED